MENNLFEDMPEAPTPPKLPKYFPELLPWIQDEDLKNLVGYGIGMFLLAGKLAKISILTGFVWFLKCLLFLSGTAIFLGLGIYKYQNQIQDKILEFEISSDLIQTKNPGFTIIERIKINPAKEKDFFEYKEDKIMNFKIEMIPTINGQPPNCDSVIEEVRSLDNVSKIEYYEYFDFQEDNHFHGKLIRSILSRPYLKQIIFHAWSDNFLDVEKIEEEYPKNLNVEEITFDLFGMAHSFKFYNKVLDALPNIKKVNFLNYNDFENLPVYLKKISGLKHLKSLNVVICAHKFPIREIRECCKIIKDYFPMISEVVIAYQAYITPWNLIEKKEGENPKIVNDLFT